MKKQKQKEPLSIMIAKTALAIAVFTGLGTIIIGGGVVIMKYYSGEVNNRIVETVDQEKENCAKEGEHAGGSCVGCVQKCCSGLKVMARKKINGQCTDIVPPGGGGICSNCGNGICDKQNNEDECNCPEDCGEEIDEILYCNKDNDCAVYFSHCDCEYHCVNKDAEIEECDCICNETGPIISECVCENNKCVDKELSTSDWQTYQNEEFGFEFHYPEIGEYYGDEIKLFEKENVIKLCTKDDMGREYNFCHSLEVFRISEGEIVKNAIKKIRIKDEDQSVCFIKEYQLYDDWNFKTYKIVDQTGAASPIGPCGYYGFELFAADPKNSQIFFLLPVIQDSFLDVEKWLKSFKFIES